MLRVLPDVEDFKILQVRSWFKSSQEAVKEPALIQAAQREKHSVGADQSHFVGRSLSPSHVIPMYLPKF